MLKKLVLKIIFGFLFQRVARSKYQSIPILIDARIPPFLDDISSIDLDNLTVISYLNSRFRERLAKNWLNWATDNSMNNNDLLLW